MTTVQAPSGTPVEPSAAGPRTTPLLENGDRLTRAEFHRRYEAMPKQKKAELVEGVVYLAPPVRLKEHGEPHADLQGWIGYYQAFTKGVAGADNATVRLDLDNELQPDALLMIETDRGGQSRVDADDFLEEAPEMVLEVVASAASYELYDRMNALRRNGVRECVIWRVVDCEIDWFVLRDERYQRLERGDDGVYRSEVFPGLWLDVAAMLGGDLQKVLAVLQQGVASEEHGAFAEHLATAAGNQGGEGSSSNA